MATKASKYCGSCGRIFNWRPSMAQDWANARYCSKTCRSHRSMHNRTDKLIELSFLTLLLENQTSSHPDPGKRKVTCEAVQEHDGGERTDVSWRERYRRAARRLANVREVCWIERHEQGKWQLGDGKGSMRVGLREGTEDDAKALAAELAGPAPATQTHENDSDAA